MTSDPNSSANFTSFLTTHLHLNLSVDFSSKILKGFVEISFKKFDDSESIVLDVANVLVKSVTHQDIKIPVQTTVRTKYLTIPPFCFSVCF